MAKRHYHIHKYKRVKWGRKKSIIWKCMLPKCPHYMDHALIENKQSICWQCGKPLLMTKDRMLRVKPKCPDCIRHPTTTAEIILDDLLKGL